MIYTSNRNTQMWKHIGCPLETLENDEQTALRGIHPNEEFEYITPLKEEDQGTLLTLGEPDYGARSYEQDGGQWQGWYGSDNAQSAFYHRSSASTTSPLPSLDGPLTPVSPPDYQQFAFQSYDPINHRQDSGQLITTMSPILNNKSGMIKGCLKIKIDENRKARGQPPIDNFLQVQVKEEPKEPEVRSWEDEERRRRRRERNKVAAAKCRNKKKHHAKILDWESVTLRQENQQMREEKQQLEMEVYNLQRCLNDHCCLRPASCPGSYTASGYNTYSPAAVASSPPGTSTSPCCPQQCISGSLGSFNPAPSSSQLYSNITSSWPYQNR